MMPNYTAKTQDKTTQYGWKNHEDDPMEQMRRSLLSKDDQIQQLKRTIQDEVKEKYLKQLQLDVNKYEPLIFNYGKTIINLNNLDFNELSKLNNNENFNNMLNINFEFEIGRAHV